MKKVGIVGYGHVGHIMRELFPSADIYDEPKRVGSRARINKCDVTFVCVPTPMAEDGSCDTSIVENVLSWIESSVIVLRSTVPVGFTDNAMLETQKHIVFQPEYYGETFAHPFENPRNRSWITLGGHEDDTRTVAELYQTVFTSELIINQVDTRVAELAKYMENAFLATKVTFCNQFYDLAQALNIDYNQVRETWLLDPRIGRSHTFVYPDNRGYGGSCLPKDLAAITKQADDMDIPVPMLKAVAETNYLYNQRTKGE